MYTPAQVARKANIHVNTVRKWSADYAEFLSPEARGNAGTRLFSEEDVDTLRTVAALRRTGMLPEVVKERLAANAIPPVVEVNPPFIPPLPPPHTPSSTPHTADMIPSIGYTALQARLDTLERRQDTLLRAAVLWGALLGAIAALAGAAFVVWLLWLLANGW